MPPLPPPVPDGFSALIDGPWVHRTVPANGISLHVAELGAGPLVLLLHGFPQFWWAWHRQLVDLADAGFRAVAVDLRGYGGSDKPPRGYDLPTLAMDVTKLIASLGQSAAVVVGSDVGALLGWTMAATHPQVVRGLVTLGMAHPLRLRHAIGRDRAQRKASNYLYRTFQVPRRAERLLSRDDRWVRDRFDAWTGPGWQSTPQYEPDVQRFASAMRVHPVAYCAAEAFRWMVRSQLRRDGQRYARALRHPITAPVLQLHGALDSCVLPATAQGSGQYVTGPYEWRLLEGTGHYPHSESPELVSGALQDFAKHA
jgi:pimeloyl-ACP methyl ester carboxylesterase